MTRKEAARRLTATIVMFGLVSVAGAFAQNLTVSSLQSDFSAGLFDNELGAALSVTEDGRGPGFTDLGDRSYLFAGLGNIGKTTANLSFTGSRTNPLLFGAYVPAVNIAAFTGIHFDGNRETDTEVTVDPANEEEKQVDDDTYHWVSERTTTEDLTRETFRVQAQGITQLGGMNVGVYVDVDREIAGTLDITIVENYFDADAADLDVEPDVVHQDTVTTTETTGGSFDVTLAVPIFMPGNRMAHYINPRVGFLHNAEDSTSEFTEVDFNDLPAGQITRTEVDDETIDTQTEFRIGGDYGLLLPALFGDDGRNGFRIDGSVDVVFHGGRDESRDIETDLEFDGDSVDETPISDETVETDNQGATDFSVAAGVSHSFYYDLGDDMHFAFAPGLMLGFATEAMEDDDNEVKKRPVSRTTTDEIAETEMGVTTEYERWNRDNTISASFRLPVAFTTHPEDWLFGFTFSGTPEITYARTAEIRYQERRSSVTTEFTDATGTTTESTDYYEESEAERSVEHDWSFSADYDLGIHVPLGEHVNLDIGLGAGGLLNFNGMTIQAIIGF